MADRGFQLPRWHEIDARADNCLKSVGHSSQPEQAHPRRYVSKQINVAVRTVFTASYASEDTEVGHSAKLAQLPRRFLHADL